MERDNNKCCKGEWKSCKACLLKISVDKFCEQNVGKYGCMKSDAAIKEEKTKHFDKQKEERAKHLQKMKRQVEESEKNIERKEEEKVKRAAKHQQLMQRHREESEKEQKEWVTLFPELGWLRAKLYSSGSVIEERTSDSGLIQLQIKSNVLELEKLKLVKGFKILNKQLTKEAI